MKPKYTLEPGRHVDRDGKPFFYVGGAGNYSPYEIDQLVRRIVALLNEHGFACAPAYSREGGQ